VFYSDGSLGQAGTAGADGADGKDGNDGSANLNLLEATGATINGTLIVDSSPCYCPGTLILTERGEVKVEQLAIGDLVSTMSGQLRPIKWIGRRDYGGRFVMGRKDILPICFRAGSLGDRVPRRDLWISPHHAMYLDGLLVEARHLVNGASVVQAEHVEEVSYIHIELETHDVLVAEGSFSESFVDDDSRNMFHNAAEFAELYPEQRPQRGADIYCAPRPDDGFEVEAIRRRIGARAGLFRIEAEERLEGFVDVVGAQSIEGWAQSVEHPEVPVCLDILVNGEPVGQLLANEYREDLRTAGVGSGCHGFRFTVPAGLNIEPERVEVRRCHDGALLALASGNEDLRRAI
jgi:hypothetical protein